jgi:hypothetical protein
METGMGFYIYMYVIKRIYYGLWLDKLDVHPMRCVFSIPERWWGDRKHPSRWIKTISSQKPWGIPLYISFKSLENTFYKEIAGKYVSILAGIIYYIFGFTIPMYDYFPVLLWDVNGQFWYTESNHMLANTTIFSGNWPLICCQFQASRNKTEHLTRYNHFLVFAKQCTIFVMPIRRQILVDTGSSFVMFDIYLVLWPSYQMTPTKLFIRPFTICAEHLQ